MFGIESESICLLSSDGFSINVFQRILRQELQNLSRRPAADLHSIKDSQRAAKNKNNMNKFSFLHCYSKISHDTTFHLVVWFGWFQTLAFQEH
jgi:hypothetical protein